MPAKKKALADANEDGKISRSEAKKAKMTVEGADTNDDGRVTRVD